MYYYYIYHIYIYIHFKNGGYGRHAIDFKRAKKWRFSKFHQCFFWSNQKFIDFNSKKHVQHVSPAKEVFSLVKPQITRIAGTCLTWWWFQRSWIVDISTPIDGLHLRPAFWGVLHPLDPYLHGRFKITSSTVKSPLFCWLNPHVS